MVKTVERDASGKFLKGRAGGPGRPPGRQNGSTIDGRILQRLVLSTWPAVGGEERLIEFAQASDANYGLYLKLVCSSFPRQTDLHVEQSNPLNIVAPELGPEPVRDAFHEQLLELAAGGPITSATVMDQLEMNKNTRLGRSCLEGRPSGNGRLPRSESDASG